MAADVTAITPAPTFRGWSDTFHLDGAPQAVRAAVRTWVQQRPLALLELAHGADTGLALLPRFVEGALRAGGPVIVGAAGPVERVRRAPAGSAVTAYVRQPSAARQGVDVLQSAVLRFDVRAADLVATWARWAERADHRGDGDASVTGWWTWLVGDPRLEVHALDEDWDEGLRPRCPDTLFGPDVDGQFRQGLRRALHAFTHDDLPRDDERGLGPVMRGGHPRAAVPLGVYATWLGRADLQRAFPAVNGADYDRFLTWCQEHAERELGVPTDWYPEPAAPAHVRRTRRRRGRVRPPRPTTVAVVRLQAVGKGVSEAGELLVAQLRHQVGDVQDVVVDLVDGPWPSLDSDVVIIAVNGDHLERVVRRMTFTPNAVVLAWWWWETDVVPDTYRQAARLVDGVLAPTDFVHALLSKALDTRVIRCPTPVPLSSAPYRADRDLTDLMLLAQADGSSSLWRKNVRGVVESYLAAFPEPSSTGPRLVLKAQELDAWPAEAQWLRAATRGRSDIALIEGTLSRAEHAELLDSADVYVSPHRSEGLGLGMVGALWRGQLVIATGYGGIAEVIDDSCGVLLSFRPVIAADPSAVYAGESSWAEPELSELVSVLKVLGADPAAFGDRAAAGPDRVAHLAALCDWPALLVDLQASSRRRRT